MTTAMTPPTRPMSLPEATPRPSATDDRSLPTFLGIGAQRAGTTWLYECLAEHPEVFLTATKELDYFGVEDGRDLDWYRSQFADGSAYDVRGEITPTYMVSPRALDELAATVPDARLFLVLREPVSRAYSAYQLFRERRYGDQPFEAVCTPETDLVRYGRYAEQLEEIDRRFTPEQVKVFVYDDLEADPAGLLRELFTFLGVDPTFEPSVLSRRYNRIMFARTQATLSRLGLGFAVEWVKGNRLGDWIRAMHARRGKRGSGRIAEVDRRRIAGYFADDIERLEQRLGRDLSAWRRG